MNRTDLLLLGAMAMGSLTIGIIFLRLWRDSGDRFFLWFAISFVLQGVNRLALALAESPREGHPVHYGFRLAAYLLIVWAIIEKNRPERTSVVARH